MNVLALPFSPRYIVLSLCVLLAVAAALGMVTKSGWALPLAIAFVVFGFH